MKKVLFLMVFVLGLTLAGCTDGYVDNSQLEEVNSTLQTKISELDTSVTELTTDLETAETAILDLTEDNIALDKALELQYSKLRNAYARDLWATRKIDYDPVTFAPSNSEYCFGIFDTDWSTITSDDFTEGTGLHFEVTVLDVQWDTEAFLQDSCGNYSEFLFHDSAYGMYSMPTGLLEVGKTYDIVLYKEIYFTKAQLGYLPVSEMGEWGTYPADISGISFTEITE